MIQQIANRYTILSLIGQGGMADVYKATDMILNREVAIKILRSKLSGDPMILVRFQREASAASRLSHPNVVDIYDVGEYNGLHYIVMEYVRGPTLKQLISRRGALDVSEAVFIMKQLTSAVSHAHAHHIIHRDIKPQNILVKDDGTVKITDFGIAVAADNVALTYNNAVMGSAHYLAPESAQGKEPNELIDIYSLGIVFYELLSGEVPFRGKTPTEIAIKHLREPIPSIRSYNPDIPQSVENIVLKATAKNPGERYQSADELLKDLQKCLLPQYKDAPKIHIENKLIPVVEVEDGHVKVIDYEESKKPVKAKKRRWLNISIVALSLVVGLALIVLIFSLTGIIQLPAVFGYEQMPAVVSLSRQEALDLLVESGVAQENIVFKEVLSDSVDAGFVISASVEEGNWINKNEEIVITLSKGGSYLINDYTGRYLDDVKEELEKDGVSLTYSINYLGVADTNPGIILEQSLLNPGDRIDPDEEAQIEFTVSKYPSITIDKSLIGMDVSSAKEYLNSLGIAVSLVQSGTAGNNVVTDVYPAIGTEYTQSGTDSVVILYYN